SRSAICAQREAIGVFMCRIRLLRNAPLAPPHGFSPSPSAVGSSLPTTQGSRRAQPGYSTGGCTERAGWRFAGLTSSIAVSSPAPDVSGDGAVDGCPCGVAAAGFGLAGGG